LWRITPSPGLATGPIGPSSAERCGLPRNDQQTLYRTLERLGMHADEVMVSVRDAIFSTYDFPKTDVNLDWTSFVLHGEAAEPGRYGYSRDHRPDKRQLTLGMSELASPVNIPFGMRRCARGTSATRRTSPTPTVRCAASCAKGRLSSSTRALLAGEQGACPLRPHAQPDFKKPNKSDDLRIRICWKRRPEVVDPDKRIVGVTYEKPHSTDYLYFSGSLHDNQMQSAAKCAHSMVDEAVELQRDLDAGKKVKMRFRGGVREKRPHRRHHDFSYETRGDDGRGGV
jgi:hypothetical protein